MRQNNDIEASDELLVNLADYGFELEPVYYNAGLSDTPEMYLRKSVSELLAAVRVELAPLNFKIWDGWRPREVQHKIYLNYWKKMATEHPDWSEERLHELVGTSIAEIKFGRPH